MTEPSEQCQGRQPHPPEVFHCGLRCSTASLVEMLVTDLMTELALLCLAVWKASFQGGLACPVYREWWGRSELFNFKCYNKANVVETKEMSIENTNLELRARTVGPHTLPLGLLGLTPCLWPLGSGLKDAVPPSSGHCLLGCMLLDRLCHKSSGLTMTCKFPICHCILRSHKVWLYLRFSCSFTF